MRKNPEVLRDLETATREAIKDVLRPIIKNAVDQLLGLDFAKGSRFQGPLMDEVPPLAQGWAWRPVQVFPRVRGRDRGCTVFSVHRRREDGKVATVSVLVPGLLGIPLSRSLQRRIVMDINQRIAEGIEEWMWKDGNSLIMVHG